MNIRKCNMKKSYPKFAVPVMMALCAFGLASCNDKNDDFDDKGSSEVVSIVTPPTSIYG